MGTLSPFVYWAQNEANVVLKIDLKDVKTPDIHLDQRKLYFKANGIGAHGFRNYEFFIDFHSDVDTQNKIVKITDHKVDLAINKIEKGWWPRLTAQPQRPSWLKIDFDKWQSEDDMEEETRNIQEDYPGLYDMLQKEELGYRKEDFKKIYLTFYNLFMYVGFMYISAILCLRYIREGPAFFPTVYASLGPVLCFMQLLQSLEILHPMFGYVKGGMLMPTLQILGRLFVLILNLDQEPRLQVMPVIFYLFLSWSAIEIIRYPYYMSQLYKKENKLLTWIRYTAWIILYPIGFSCESIILFRNLIFVDQSKKWSISLPNAFNFTFDYATFLRIYLLFISLPAMSLLIKHMYNARKQKLGSKMNKIKRS